MPNGKPEHYLQLAKPARSCKGRFKGTNKVRRKARLNARSKKRRELDKVYSKLRKEFLALKPKCEVCGVKPSQDVHHRKRRTNGNYLRVETFLAVCRQCHCAIHHDVAWAKAEGYLL